MTIYILLWLAVIAAGKVSKNAGLHPKYFLVVSFCCMAFVAGLRGPAVGEDTVMYLNIANSAARQGWMDILSSFPTAPWNFISYGIYGKYIEKIETAYLLYNKLIMSVFHHPQWVLLFTSLMTNTLMGKFILDNVSVRKNIYSAVYIYMCDAIFMNSLNIMRQMFALSIAAQSIGAVRNSRYKNAILWILLASLIHQSAILFIVVYGFYLIPNKRKNYKYFLMAACVLPAILPILSRMVEKIIPKYAIYLRVNFWQSQAGGIAMLWAFVVAVIVVINRSFKSTDYDWWLVYVATLYLGIELIGLRYTAIARAAMYFRISLILLLPEAKKYFRARSRLVYEMAIFVLMTFSYLSYASSPARYYSLEILF